MKQRKPLTGFEPMPDKHPSITS